MSTISQIISPPASPAPDALGEDEAALASLSAAGNHAAPTPLSATDGLAEGHVQPEAHYAAPHVYQAVVAPEFHPGCREQGQVRLRMKISSRG